MLTVFDPPSIDLGGPILSSRRRVVKPGLAATAFGGTGLTTRRLLELLATVSSTEGSAGGSDPVSENGSLVSAGHKIGLR